MLRIAICDDEVFYRKKIYHLVETYMNRQELECEIQAYASGKAFLSQTENAVNFDIVFMDINMEELDGIETAMQMRCFHSDTYLVLVTAFIHYVLEGYKVNAVRYIMKDTLDTAIDECLDAILQKRKSSHVTFSFVEGIRKLYTDNILYVESRKHKSIFYYMESKIVTYQIYEKLDAIEQQMADYDFLRIHKSYLVNSKHIRKISNYLVTLDTGEELSVPRSRYQFVKEAFVAYKGAL